MILFALVSLALLLSGCGPSDEEAARAVMMATPIVYMAGLAVMILFVFLWRKLKPELSLKKKPVLVGLVLALIVGLLSFVGVSNESPEADDWESITTNGISGVVEWFVPALIFYGASYLALLLVWWRFLLWRHPAGAFSLSWIPMFVLMLLPCPHMILGLGYSNLGDIAIDMWMLIGLGGWVTLPLFLIALIEVLVRIIWRIRIRNATKRE